MDDGCNICGAATDGETSGKQKGLHMVFIDLETAYDRVPRQEVWRCMREKSVPEKYVMIVYDMYEGAITWVKSSVGLTDMIPV